MCIMFKYRVKFFGWSGKDLPDYTLTFLVRRYFTRAVRKVKNVCAYNPRSCFIVPDQSFGVFNRV